MDEFERIAALRRLFEAGDVPAPPLGIGDDAALLVPCGPAERLVWTIDAAVEGVHFRRGWLSLEELGFRSLMAAASDLAAMGGRAIGFLSALVLPRELSDEDLEAIARGQATAARACGARVVGGNLSRGGELSLTTTALGAVTTALRRDGAREGDRLIRAGELGLAALGRALIEAGQAAPERPLDAWRRPTARLVEGQALGELARAAIDVSDGMTQDLAHVAHASGVSFVIDAAMLTADWRDEERWAARRLSLDPTQLALSGGEDYALLATLPHDAAVPPFALAFGEAVAPASAPILVRGLEAELVVVSFPGFRHFG